MYKKALDLLPEGSIVITEDTRDSAPLDKPYHVLVLVEKGQYVGAVDTNHGRDMLFDGNLWHICKQGVFLRDVVFLTDYYGYPKGELFLKA